MYVMDHTRTADHSKSSNHLLPYLTPSCDWSPHPPLYEAFPSWPPVWILVALPASSSLLPYPELSWIAAQTHGVRSDPVDWLVPQWTTLAPPRCDCGMSLVDFCCCCNGLVLCNSTVTNKEFTLMWVWHNLYHTELHVIDQLVAFVASNDTEYKSLLCLQIHASHNSCCLGCQIADLHGQIGHGSLGSPAPGELVPAPDHDQSEYVHCRSFWGFSLCLSKNIIQYYSKCIYKQILLIQLPLWVIYKNLWRLFPEWYSDGCH